MERDVRMIIVADTNTAESRQIIAQLAENPAIPQTVVTPQMVRRIIPIRANPAVGVMIWSTDLQGLATDVAAFADYIKRESENKRVIADAADVAQAYIDLLIGDETEV